MESSAKHLDVLKSQQRMYQWRNATSTNREICIEETDERFLAKVRDRGSFCLRSSDEFFRYKPSRPDFVNALMDDLEGSENEKIEVDRKRLLSILKDNRAKHAQEYAINIASWYANHLSEISEYKKAVENLDPRSYDGWPDVPSNEDRPQYWGEYYDEAIIIVKSEDSETIQLDNDTYNKWIHDMWPWKTNR